MARMTPPADTLPDSEEHESEETTTTYLREMGQFDLLTPEEEAKYSKTIREGFDAIIEAIREDTSGVPEIKMLVDRIDLWQRRDPTLKPKKAATQLYAALRQYRQPQLSRNQGAVRARHQD